jgi:hypothetical protein
VDEIELDVLLNIERKLARIIDLLEEDVTLLQQLVDESPRTFTQGTGVTFAARPRAT